MLGRMSSSAGMPTRWREAWGRRGMVAAPHALGSQSGLAVLRAGGNALDAAIAAATTMAVVYPHMNGLGGDNFWLIYDASAGTLRGLTGCGRSAMAATIDWYAARGVVSAIPIRGGLAALTVPGTVSGWWEAHDYSRRRMDSPLVWGDLLADAIAYARDGFPPVRSQLTPPPREPDLFGEGAVAALREGLWPLHSPEALASGPLRQQDLARTLEAIRDGGPDVFYRGEVARRLCAALAAAGSPLGPADFAEHQAEWVDPLRVPFARGEVASLPPPTQGISALAMLALAEGFELGALPEADYIHILVEATKLAFEDRDREVTDPAFMRVPVDALLAPDHLATLRGQILRRAARRVRPTTATAAGDTISVVAADGAGNAVSLIQSLYFTYGSGLVAGDTGVILQNRGSFFGLDPAQANALAPRKRTLHTLVPAVYLERGRPRFVCGTMGGEGQPQTLAALITRRLLRGFGTQAAVEAPRWVYGRTWGAPSRSLTLEGRYPLDVAQDLAGWGHDVKRGQPWDALFGHAQAIWISPEGEGLEGGSDPRADGAAVGF
jgi:gamma-glutamyltranspeptidase